MGFWDMQNNIFSMLLFSFGVIVLFYLIPLGIRKYYLLTVNFLFYFLCDARYFLLMAMTVLWTYFAAQQLEKNRKWLWLGIIPIVGSLFLFKYFNFFCEQASVGLRLAMPLGISYYTFKCISYLADIYLKKRTRQDSLLQFAVYVSFFPQIICGPIARMEETDGFWNRKEKRDCELFNQGILLVISGLFKKIVIADRLSGYVNTIFSGAESYPALALWMAAFFYTVQLYCDFAGYSEVAIGIGNLLGMPCRKNFDLPYFSNSIKEFWRRWHISLSGWLRDYVYIPLGGSQRSKGRKALNLLITFGISGIWHGSGINFLIWGLYHGILNLLSGNKMCFRNKIGQVVRITGTFVLVMFGWIIFRADTLLAAVRFMIRMFVEFSVSYQDIVNSVMPFTNDYSCVAYLLTVLIMIGSLFCLELRDYLSEGQEKNSLKNGKLRYAFLVVAIILFGVTDSSSFLYANF